MTVSRNTAMGTKLVFLDRDGVINEYPGDKNYVTGIDFFHILPRSKSALEKLTAAGFRIYVVSNQAGVSKGLYSRETLDQIDAKMARELGEKVKFSGILYCTHRPEESCACRKPKTGLLDKVFAGLAETGEVIDRENSYFIGDSLIDVQTGRAAGLKTILVFSGKEKSGNQLNWAYKPDHIADDLAGAVEIIRSL